MTFSCRSCGWSKTTPRSGDVRVPGLNWHDRCPTCGSEALNKRSANELEKLFSMLGGASGGKTR